MQSGNVFVNRYRNKIDVIKKNLQETPLLVLVCCENAWRVCARSLCACAPRACPHRVRVPCPDRYLGEQRLAYDQALSFQLWTGGDRARASIIDVIIEGNGRQISAPIFAQGNPTPGTVKQDYRFRLNEHANYQWTPRLSANEFIQLLSNITAIRIRGTYSPRGMYTGAHRRTQACTHLLAAGYSTRWANTGVHKHTRIGVHTPTRRRVRTWWANTDVHGRTQAYTGVHTPTRRRVCTRV